ncbi:MAG TPA: hypothetical protein VIT88_04135 [Pyrinomonadaceae bacterium]
MITVPRNVIGGMLFLALVCFAVPVTAQPAAGNSEKEQQQKQELTKKAYALVDEIATASNGLKLPENRSYILTAAAELLWNHDPKRARSIYWDALASINLMAEPTANGATSKKSTRKDENRYYAIFRLRQELLRAVARHDPQLALDMLRSSRQMAPPQTDANYRPPDDSDLEQQIATEAAARDPERALEFAREGLAKGLTVRTLEMIDRLNGLDQEVAAKFAGDVIDKLQTKHLGSDISASRIALNLLFWSRGPGDAAVKKDAALADRYRLKLKTETRRQLVEMITNAALTVSANSDLLNSITEIIPEIQEFFPERVVPLQKKVSVFEQTLNKEQRSWNDYNSVVRSGSPEQMITASLKADDDQREMLRHQAVVTAIYRQRADALREFIRNEIDDESLQRSLSDSLDAEQITAATIRGDADELRTLLPRVRRSEQRARAMAEIAVVLEKKGEHDEAVKLLDEARTLIKVDFESESQSNALLALVAAYAVVDPAKAFAIIERTIDRANDQISKALLLDKIVKTGVIKNGELILQNSRLISPDFMLFRYGTAINTLATADFNRTRAAADRFERMELRLMMRLLLAQALLKDERKAKWGNRLFSAY